MLQWDINKTFSRLELPVGAECIGDKERVCKQIDLPDRLWRSIVCLSKNLGMTPSQLVYRVIVAPHLIDIIKENSFVTGISGGD